MSLPNATARISAPTRRVRHDHGTTAIGRRSRRAGSGDPSSTTSTRRLGSPMRPHRAATHPGARAVALELESRPATDPGRVGQLSPHDTSSNPRVREPGHTSRGTHRMGTYHLLVAIEKTLLDQGVHTSWASVPMRWLLSIVTIVLRLIPAPPSARRRNPSTANSIDCSAWTRRSCRRRRSGEKQATTNSDEEIAISLIYRRCDPQTVEVGLTIGVRLRAGGRRHRLRGSAMGTAPCTGEARNSAS